MTNTAGDTPKVLVINCGSSSIKYGLFAMAPEQQGHADQVFERLCGDTRRFRYSG
jgi:acetate kinase